MGGITWALGRTLAEHLAPAKLVPGDRALSLARAVKSPWELEIIRAAGADHDRCLRERLPPLIAPGMTEREIAHRVWEVLFAAGHQGLLRMENYGEEVFLGHVSAGESGNYPSVFNGPVGLRGEHPATPHMGSSKRWERGEPLVCDIGFVRSGYHTDKTQVYFAGPRAAIPARAAAAHDVLHRGAGLGRRRSCAPGASRRSWRSTASPGPSGPGGPRGSWRSAATRCASSGTASGWRSTSTR